MAKHGIFIDGSLVRLAATDAETDTLIAHGWNGTVKTLTDTQFTDFSTQKKFATLSGDTISEEDSNLSYPTTVDGVDVTAKSREALKSEIDGQIELVTSYLENHTSTDWTTYKTKLEALD